MLSHMFQGLGGGLLALGLVAMVLGGAAALMGVADEQDNQDRKGLFDHPDDERSEMNWGLAQGGGAILVAGAAAAALGVVLVALGGATRSA